VTIQIIDTPLDHAARLEIAKRRSRVPSFEPGLKQACVGFGKAGDNVEALSSGKALCVTTGQQPGIFLGPAFTVYKALSVIALAERLTEYCGKQVVPVFWVAGDDHDFAEANHVHVLDRDHGVRKIQLDPRDGDASSLPLYRELLDEGIKDVLRTFADTLPHNDFFDDVGGWLEQQYAPGKSMAGAFAHSLAELLGDRGLVVFQPTHNEAKRVQSQWILKALERAEVLDRSLNNKASELNDRGAPVPVPIHPGDTLVMIEGSQGRDRLRMEGSRFVARRSGESWSLDELREILRKDPELFSANVLLRPVVEAAILPTVAYVAGPGELKYINQAEPVYEELDITPQTYLPRWSGVMVEPKVGRVLEKFNLSLEELNAPEGQIEGRLAADMVPNHLKTGLADLKNTLDEYSAGIVSEARKIDPTLEKPAAGAFRQIQFKVEHLEKRIASRIKAKNEITLRQIRDARNAVFPHGKPQERVFGFVQYLVRYGPTLLEQLSVACKEWADKVSVSDEGK